MKNYKNDVFMQEENFEECNNIEKSFSLPIFVTMAISIGWAQNDN